MELSNLDQLVLPATYREQRQHIFPSPSSFDWFLRKHRSELVAVGALLFLTGRWFARPAVFDAFIVALGKKDTLRHRQVDGGN